MSDKINKTGFVKGESFETLEKLKYELMYYVN